MNPKHTTSSDYQLRKEIGNRLKQAREAKGMTQEDMGKLFNMTAQGYSRYERGTDIRGTLLIQFCSVLECSPDWILGVTTKGKQLHPESELLIALKKTVLSLNQEGQRKVSEYASDIASSPKYTIGISRGVPDDSVSVAG